MDVYQNYIILVLVSIYYHSKLYAAAITSKTLIYKQEYRGKTCPSEDHIFTTTIRSKTACLELCTRTSGCTSAAFIQGNFVCTGCNGFYHSATDLVDQSDALFYIQLVDCGTPVTVNHVIYQKFDAYTRYGAEVKFRCSPCTYFSLSSTWKIRCQVDGYWTMPDCVYGPDVGYLRNGDIIPTWVTGCRTTFGTTCNHEQNLTGTVLRYNGEIRSDCYCDHACCGQDDCCYDSIC